ncbi:sugar ABC transporter substrate-binding protein [candidate division KSB3 bacterium]|uniref:Sugar ABC transporter substrate-binding protein n=1 Tax=candidate division KSB3 bacterium TaxID=2044937 RepID=A0A2G6E5H8_9BACT|nr:MAG: sugar ABC transporter substrate-binding protein [candidate division KSB3 bacterium]PIE29858.1 MAG: sugar ABC transporter substrate-binding protein [candidate division KSB3 bacterium]
MKKILLCLVCVASLSSFAWSDVTIEFIQWWAAELPEGSFRELMDEFELRNPGIMVELISGPYANTRDQIVTGAATGTLSDVVGLDGAWVNDLAKQGAIAPLDELMASSNFDADQLAARIKLDGKSYMFPVASFVYPVFINLDMFKAADIEKLPSNRSEFFEAAKKLTDASKNQYGWVLPLSLQAPNGVQNDIMSWVWASGASMLKDGKADLTNNDVISVLNFVKKMYNNGVISPGSFVKKEMDKVEEFVNGRIGMMISSLAHINLTRERNPELNFTISALPAADGYDGKRGLPYAAWGIGISESSEQKEEAWKLICFLMSPEINSKLVSLANAFPGNVRAKPDFVASDALFEKAFEIFQTGYLANEFVGLPVAEELMRMFDEEIQKMLDGKQSPEEAAAAAQVKWDAEF